MSSPTPRPARRSLGGLGDVSAAPTLTSELDWRRQPATCTAPGPATRARRQRDRRPRESSAASGYFQPPVPVVETGRGPSSGEGGRRRGL